MNIAIQKPDWFGLRGIESALALLFRDPAGAWRRHQARQAFVKDLDAFYSDWAEQISSSTFQLAIYFGSKAARAKARRSPVEKVYLDLRRRAEAGEGVADMLRPYVPPEHLMHIETAESAGDLLGGIKQAQFAMRSINRMQDLMLERLVGPALLLLAMLGVYVGMFGGWLVPKLTSGELKLQPNIVLSVGVDLADLFVSHPFVMVISVAVAVRLFLSSFTELTGLARQRLDGFFPWSVYRLFRAGQFFLMLSPMLKHNMPVSHVLGKIAASASRYERGHYLRMAREIAGGNGSAKAFDTGFIPNEMIDRMYTFEANGRFDYILREIGTSTFQTTYEMVDRATRRVAGVMKIASYVTFMIIFTSIFGMLDINAITGVTAPPTNITTTSK